MEFLYEYGLFLAKAVTLVVAFILVVSTIVGVANKQKQGRGHLEIQSLTDQLKDITHYARQVLLDKATLKKLAKQQKKEEKAKVKAKEDEREKGPRLFVIDFKVYVKSQVMIQLQVVLFHSHTPDVFCFTLSLV